MDLRRWRMKLRYADIRYEGTLYSLIEREVGSARGERAPLRLVITVPTGDWAWFSARPPEFQDDYRRGLTEYLRSRSGEPGRAALAVDLREGAEGEAWSASWEWEEAPTPAPAARGRGQAYVIWPDADYPRWIPWEYGEDPRIPEDEEAAADPAQLPAILARLAAPGGRRWRADSGEPEWLCGRRCFFVRTEGGEGR